MTKRLFMVVLSGSFLTANMGCADWSRTQKGAAIGAGTAGAIGGIIGKDSVRSTLVEASWWLIRKPL